MEVYITALIFGNSHMDGLLNSAATVLLLDHLREVPAGVSLQFRHFGPVGCGSPGSYAVPAAFAVYGVNGGIPPPIVDLGLYTHTWPVDG